MSDIAKEVMTTPAVSITENQSIKDVIELLAKGKFSGVPVVDEKINVVGILSTQISSATHNRSASFLLPIYPGGFPPIPM